MCPYSLDHIGLRSLRISGTQAPNRGTRTPNSPDGPLPGAAFRTPRIPHSAVYRAASASRRLGRRRGLRPALTARRASPHRAPRVASSAFPFPRRVNEHADHPPRGASSSVRWARIELNY